MREKIFFKRLLCAVVLGLLWSCSPYFHQPLGEERGAKLGPETPLKRDLLELPEPQEPIVVAVYKFRDQTGQYKPSATGANWSTAVTQGATNILVRALEESGWFIPIERENISNLLNERKIIRSSREQYEGGSGAMLPPLLFAGVLLEGGIVSYETNVYTGGAGVRYFGTDASAQYREDRVSIYLRAVSTSNGKILKTVYTTKSILSQEVSMGVFRYVKFKRLLEAETGYTYNEPTELAVTEAIEKAVHSLIVEGVLDNLWTLKNKEDISSDQIQEYIKEKKENVNVDVLGRSFDSLKRGKVYMSLMGSGQFYAGDYSTSYVRPGGSVGLGIGFTKNFFMEANVGMQQVHVKDLMTSNELCGDLNVLYMANPNGKFSPYVGLGIGAYYDQDKTIGLSGKEVLPFMVYSGGAEYLLSDWVAVSGGAFVNQMFSDMYDRKKVGGYNDRIWGFKLGARFYFGQLLGK